MDSGRPDAPADRPRALRVEELSRVTEVSVRNVREYQDRGLLPPPERDGRVAFYGEEHVVRLRLIVRLLDRGYTLAVIKDLLEAWAGGRDLHDVLGLEEVARRPWGLEERVDLTRAELDALFGGRLADKNVEQMVATGVLVPGDGVYNCSRRKLVEVVPVLVAADIPMDAALDALVQIRHHMDAVAKVMVGLVVGQLLPSAAPGNLPAGDDMALLSASVDRLRQVAVVIAEGMFGLAMTDAAEEAVSRILGTGPRPGASSLVGGRRPEA